MRVGLAFPWRGIRVRDHGSAQRIGLLVDFLRERVDDIRVLSPSPAEAGVDGNVGYTSYELTPDEARREHELRRKVRSAARLATGSDLAPNEELWLCKHVEHRFLPTLVSALQEVVDWSDVILVSFTFWSRAVARMARRKGIPLIVTTHDVGSDQVESSALLRWLTRRLEVGGLAKAKYRFASSERDQRRFRAHGVTTEIVLPGVDMSRPLRASASFDGDEPWRQRFGLPLGKAICLFVGTSHGPNVPAVRAIRGLADRLAGQGRDDILFLVVGDAAPPERRGTFIALGGIEQPALDALYLMSDVVLVPLQAGTGTSRKTLEALAFGKPILGTGMGFRGIPVSSGLNGIVSDDLASWPELVRKLVADVELRRTLAVEARELARVFDYRVVYERYAEIISAAGRGQDRPPRLSPCQRGPG